MLSHLVGVDNESATEGEFQLGRYERFITCRRHSSAPRAFNFTTAKSYPPKFDPLQSPDVRPTSITEPSSRAAAPMNALIPSPGPSYQKQEAPDTRHKVVKRQSRLHQFRSRNFAHASLYFTPASATVRFRPRRGQGQENQRIPLLKRKIHWRKIRTLCRTIQLNHPLSQQPRTHKRHRSLTSLPEKLS